MHGGIDIAGIPEGTPVHSMYPGVVDYSGWASGYGNLVSARITDGLYQGNNIRYGHLSQPSALRQGDMINAGDFIGRVGHTGMPNLPTHLHIDIGPVVITPRQDRLNINGVFQGMYVK